MDTKNVIAAISLSAAVIILYSLFFAPSPNELKKIEDNTSSNVEIIVYLKTGSSISKTIDALYAFSQCEVSISPLSCIISNNKPEFIGVSDILKTSTENTRELLKEELEIELEELNNQWHNISLEKIFIENRIYRDIEDKTCLLYTSPSPRDS